MNYWTVAVFPLFAKVITDDGALIDWTDQRQKKPFPWRLCNVTLKKKKKNFIQLIYPTETLVI